jgi:hypothetical protein
MVTVDQFGLHWFCSAHWAFVHFLFSRLVVPCTRNGDCKKNHSAELYESDRTYLTVKFEDKYYDVCSKHMNMYDDLLGITVLDFNP